MIVPEFNRRAFLQSTSVLALPGIATHLPVAPTIEGSSSPIDLTTINTEFESIRKLPLVTNFTNWAFTQLKKALDVFIGISKPMTPIPDLISNYLLDRNRSTADGILTSVFNRAKHHAPTTEVANLLQRRGPELQAAYRVAYEAGTRWTYNAEVPEHVADVFRIMIQRGIKPENFADELAENMLFGPTFSLPKNYGPATTLNSQEEELWLKRAYKANQIETAWVDTINFRMPKQVAFLLQKLKPESLSERLKGFMQNNLKDKRIDISYKFNKFLNTCDELWEKIQTSHSNLQTEIKNNTSSIEQEARAYIANVFNAIKLEYKSLSSALSKKALDNECLGK